MVPYHVAAAYDTWPTVAQLFPVNVIGVQTHRDQLVVADTEHALRDRLERFANPDIPDSEWEKQGVKIEPRLEPEGGSCRVAGRGPEKHQEVELPRAGAPVGSVR